MIQSVFRCLMRPLIRRVDAYARDHRRFVGPIADPIVIELELERAA